MRSITRKGVFSKEGCALMPRWKRGRTRRNVSDRQSAPVARCAILCPSITRASSSQRILSQLPWYRTWSGKNSPWARRQRVDFDRAFAARSQSDQSADYQVAEGGVIVVFASFGNRFAALNQKRA